MGKGCVNVHCGCEKVILVSGLSVEPTIGLVYPARIQKRGVRIMRLVIGHLSPTKLVVSSLNDGRTLASLSQVKWKLGSVNLLHHRAFIPWPRYYILVRSEQQNITEDEWTYWRRRSEISAGEFLISFCTLLLPIYSSSSSELRIVSNAVVKLKLN